MKIEVFGPGCAKCNQSKATAEAFLASHQIAGEVVKHTDLATMTARGVLRTPTTMIDGQPVVEGRVLRETDLEKWLAAHGGRA
ncbi:MAG: thioredoxin family protein [Planctomycetes bacterium]|nr:thioredoxin family protein [Planctomycetota bacterium]